MSFIDDLMKSKGTGALGITYEKPKAHDNIDNLMSSNISPEIEEVIQTAIMGGIGGPAGSLKGLTQLIKSKGGVETLKKLMPDSKNVVKLIKDMNKKSLKNLSKESKRYYSEYDDKVINKFIKESDVTLTNEGRNAFNKALSEGFRGQKAIDKAFVQRQDGSYFIKPTAAKTPKLNDIAKNEIENNLATIGGIFAPIIAAVTAKKANEEYNLSGNIAKMLRPDPSMPTKQQNDEDMNLMKMLMSPETQLKYLKNTGQGYPADEEMFLNSERENTNDMLLRLLREQSE